MTIEDQQKLLQRLQENPELKRRGYDFLILGGVLVERSGHARGLWRCGPKGFNWTPAGYNEPVHWCADVDTAVAYTLQLLAGH